MNSDEDAVVVYQNASYLKMTGDGYVWLVTQQTFSGVARNYVPQGEMLDIRECVPVGSLACGNYNPGHNC